MSLSIDQLNVRFDEHHVIHSLQLELASKEIIAILGPSGCGKTTLLRTIAGLQKHDTGTIQLNGINIQEQPCELRGIGMLFQRPVLFPFKDVLGNILFAYKRKKEWNMDEVNTILNELGLKGKEHHTIETLSGG